MVRIHFGPSPCFHVDCMLNYVAQSSEPGSMDLVHDGWDNTLKRQDAFTLLDGKYEVPKWDDVSLTVKRESDMVTPGDGTVMSCISVIVDCPSIEVCDKFLAASKEFARFGKDIQNCMGVPLWIMEHGWSLDGIAPSRPMDSVVLPGEVKGTILKDLEHFLSDEVKERHKELNIPHTRIYMLHGPPGTGKTTLIQALASKFKKSIASVEFSQDVDDRMLRKCFKSAPDRAWLAIEDIDCLFDDRKAHDTMRNSVTFSGLLNTLDGIGRLKDGTVIFITTNHLKKLDEALRRRVDYFVEYDFNTKEQTQTQFNRFFPKQEDKWNDFWSGVHRLKLTPNILQKFFARHLDCEDITQHTKHLKDYILDDDPKSMYT